MAAKRVVTYLRISTANQIDNTSIETQREKIELYCKLNDYEIVKEFKDEGISAKNDHTREDYIKLMEFISHEENKIDGIIVYKSDRIHRSLWKLNKDDFLYTKIKNRFYFHNGAIWYKYSPGNVISSNVR